MMRIGRTRYVENCCAADSAVRDDAFPVPGCNPRHGKPGGMSPALAQAATAATEHAAARHALNVIHGFSRTALRMRPACSCASITGPIGL